MKVGKILSLCITFGICGDCVATNLPSASNGAGTGLVRRYLSPDLRSADAKFICIGRTKKEKEAKGIEKNLNIERNLNLAMHLLEDREKNRERLEEAEIYVDSIYKQKAVDEAFATDKWWKDLGKHVVRVNSLMKAGETFLPFIGTGTLIDLGIESLKGRVVITCGHCANDLHWFSKESYKNPDDRPGFFSVNGGAYLSVTHESKRSPPIPIINNNENDFVSKNNHNKVLKVYASSANGDVAILILEKAIEDENGNILSGEKIDANSIGDLSEFRSSPDGANAANNIIIGYGLTGTFSQISGYVFGSVGDVIGNSALLNKRQQFMGELGWGIKKSAHLNLMKIEWGNDTGRTICPSELLKGEFQTAGGGFSGSLMVGQVGGEKKYLGIYSGPVFCPKEMSEDEKLYNMVQLSPFLDFLNYVIDEEKKILTNPV
jgi:hypothetical protein